MKPCLNKLLLARGVALGDAMVRLGLREELARVRRRHFAPLLDARLRGGFGRARLRERGRELVALELDQQRARSSRDRLRRPAPPARGP